VTTVLIARHGQSTWNAEHRWQGHADPPLSDEGRRQAAALAELVASRGVVAVYSSDLARARETAEIAARAIGLRLVTDPTLREINVGEWQGLTTEEIEERFPDAWARHSAGGDGWLQGETHAAMSARIVAAVTRITNAHPGETILCVIHGGVIRALLAHAASLALVEYRQTRPGPRNGSLAGIVVEDGQFRSID